MGKQWCMRIVYLGILFRNISKVGGSNGCPESQTLAIETSYRNVSWDTTWSDYQSKTCVWRLRFQTPDIVNLTLRLDKLVLSSHDTFEYSAMGIVKTRVNDKIEVEVCGNDNKTELPTSAIGRDFRFTGSALCFFIPHASYNFGQDIFTTHFIKMEISVKRNLFTTEKQGSTTHSFEVTANRSTSSLSSTDFLKTRLTTVKAISTTVTSSSDSHPGREYASLPVRFTFFTPYFHKTSTTATPVTPLPTNSLPSIPQSAPYTSSIPQVVTFSLSSSNSTNNALQSTGFLQFNNKSTTSAISHQQSTKSQLSHRHTIPSFNRHSTKQSTPHYQQSTPHYQRSTPHYQKSTNALLSHQPSPSHPFSNHELLSTKLSTYFSRTIGDTVSTVSIASPWTLTLRTTETTLVFRTTRSNNPLYTFNDDSTGGETNLYLVAGLVSGTSVILLVMVILVVYLLRTRRRNEEETSVYSLDYSQPWPWRKNWVITRSFSEIEAERAKGELQLKPILPFRPSLKRHSSVTSSQNTATTSLDVEEYGVYDNIVS